MRLFAILILVIFITSCSSYDISITKYKSVRYSKFEQYWNYLFRGINTFAVGSEIELKSDSTYKYTTCGNIITGTWSTSEDSLLLKVLTNRWRNDSLNTYGFEGKMPEIAKEPIVFMFDSNSIHAVHINKKGRKTIQKLKVVEPSEQTNDD